MAPCALPHERHLEQVFEIREGEGIHDRTVPRGWISRHKPTVPSPSRFDILTMEQMFTNTTYLVPSGWVTVRGRASQNAALQTQLVVRANIVNVEASERSDIAPLVYASFDIECVPKTGTRFPHAHRTADQLAQIGVSLGVFGRGVVRRVVICLGETHLASLEDGSPIEIISCETERVVLQSFRDLIVGVQPDVIMGYNIFKFDIQCTWLTEPCALRRLDPTPTSER